MSFTEVTAINRINTWLTCENGCPSANGSNNIRRLPEENMKFAVLLRRDTGLSPPFTVDQAKNADLRIHYEVEGPCA